MHDKKLVFKNNVKWNSGFTCRKSTDKILRVASCISLSREIAKESTCISVKNKRNRVSHQKIFNFNKGSGIKDYKNSES